MAVVFELVIAFDLDADDAVEAAAARVQSVGGVAVRGTHLPFRAPLVSRLTATAHPYIEFSVYPAGIGWGAPGPAPVDIRSLTDDDIAQVGHDLYGVLRGLRGYRAAAVGWDPESIVDVDDLEADCRAGDPPVYDGLVLADDVRSRLGLVEGWERFTEGYSWLPYRGSRNVW